MSKFIKVTLVGQTDQMLVNVDQIKEVEIDAEGSSILVKDGYSLIVSEEIEQIEDQLLRDEFAIATLSGAMDGVMVRNLVIEDVVEAAYEVADAMLKERLK